MTGQAAVDVLPGSPPRDEAFRPREPQSLRDGRKLSVRPFGKLRDARFAPSKKTQEPETLRIAYGLEQPDSLLDRFGRVLAGLVTAR